MRNIRDYLDQAITAMKSVEILPLNDCVYSKETLQAREAAPGLVTILEILHKNISN